MRMGRRIAATLKRTAIHAGPTVLGIIVLDFLLLQLMPGDAADVIASESGVATAETMAALRERFGLDQPVLTQLVNFLGHLVQFDLGFSPRYNMSVLDMIMTRLPSTVLLMATALSLALVLGIIVGSVMAAWAGRWPDRMLSVVVLLFYSMPGFWVGLMAIVLFSVKLGWLPSDGSMTVGANLAGFAFVIDRAQHLILPPWRWPRSSSPFMPAWCGRRCWRCSARISCAPRKPRVCTRSSSSSAMRSGMR